MWAVQMAGEKAGMTALKTVGSMAAYWAEYLDDHLAVWSVD